MSPCSQFSLSLSLSLSFGMGTMAIKEAFDWVIKDPKSVRASSTVIRINDDMASHKVLRYSTP